jgi:hypothetical protein
MLRIDYKHNAPCNVYDYAAKRLFKRSINIISLSMNKIVSRVSSILMGIFKSSFLMITSLPSANIRRKVNWFFINALILIIFLSGTLNAQVNIDMSQSERKILSEYTRLLNLDLFKREAASKLFADSFFIVLQNDASFEFPFDTLHKIGKIYSADHRMRVYCWNIPIGVDQNLYYAIFQYYAKREKKYYTIKMQSKAGQKGSISAENWPGALYYEIVETKHAGQKYYTLLGLDLNNMFTNKKVIDVVSIDDFDVFYFCPKLIQYNKKMTDRLVFEYNKKASMSLKYSEDKKMIVFDHLSPEKPSMEGNYQFYGPDFTYDGLKFEKGVWVFYSNINVTN